LVQYNKRRQLIDNGEGTSVMINHDVKQLFFLQPCGLIIIKFMTFIEVAGSGKAIGE